MKDGLEWMKIDDLILNPKNPRKNQPVNEVKNNIDRFGFSAPIVARLANKMIIAGHTRWKAAKALKMVEIPVRLMDVTQEEADLLMMSDNKLGELADWTDDELKDLLLELSIDHDLQGLGWTEEELSELMEKIDPIEPEPSADNDGSDLDAIPSIVPARTQAGEVIQLGRHTLYCGDCLQVMESLPDSSVSAILCDPPYQINFMGSKLNWDQEFNTKKWSVECFRVLKSGGYLVAFAATRTIHRLMVPLEEQGFEIRDLIGWCYSSGFPKSYDISKGIDKHFGAEREVIGIDERYNESSGLVLADRKKGDRVKIKREITAPSSKEAKRFSGYG